MIFILTVINILLFHKIIERFYVVWTTSVIRKPMAVLILVNLFPALYGWFVIFIYINSGGHSLLIHQIFFTVSEWFVIITALVLLNEEQNLTFHKLNFMILTCLIHLLVAGIDRVILSLLGINHNFLQVCSIKCTATVS